MQREKAHEKLIQMVYAGLFAAMTALLTAVLHVPVGNGYVHCGDAMIYLSALLMPLPHAAFASAFGGMLADILSGYPVYAVPTFLIKGMLALCFSLICKKNQTPFRQVLAVTVCGMISVLGYWVTAVILYGGWAAQFIGTVPGNCVQAAASGILYAAVSAALERVRSQKRHYMV